MGDEKNLISLKDAAKISGYSSDYIGQLIRAGKIPGKQVYSNIAWMTTAEAVLDYKNKGKSDNNDSLGDVFTKTRRKIAMEINIFKLFFQTFKTSLPVLFVIIIAFIFLMVFLITLSFDHSRPSVDTNKMPTDIKTNLSF